MNKIQNAIYEFDSSLDFEQIDSSNGLTLFTRGKTDKLSKNYNIFTIPDMSIYNLFAKTSNEIKTYFLENNLMFERFGVYCYARLLKNNTSDFYLNMSPKIKTSFFAFLNISDESIWYYKNNEYTEIPKLCLQIMSHSDIIRLDNNIGQFDLLYISISSVESLQYQLPSLWVPVI